MNFAPPGGRAMNLKRGFLLLIFATLLMSSGCAYPRHYHHWHWR
jgi:hypothetical protein